jgi:hypothetical protein
MQLQVDLPKTTIDEVVERIFATRRITRTDQVRFMSALLSKDSLNKIEQEQINRVFDGLRNGLIKVVD